MIEYPCLKMDEKYGVPDADSEVFFQNFKALKPANIVVVGDNEENVANVLTDNGFDVTGVDLRPLSQVGFCNHKRIIGDFCDLDIGFGTVDIIICLSALEHFGLAAYGAEKYLIYHDVIAMNCMWNILKPGGVVYLTVPFGTAYMEILGNWRVYSVTSFKYRVVQKFDMIGHGFFTSGPCAINGKFRPAMSFVSAEEATEYCGDPPHVTLFVKLKKGDNKCQSQKELV